jgi:hypothetical protein
MAVKTITAEINGQVRRITADIPDGATDQDIIDAVSSMASSQQAIPQGELTKTHITDIKYKPDAPINTYNPTGKQPESYISGPKGILEKTQSLYREYVPGSIQDAISNIIKVGKVSGLDQPMAAYAPAGKIVTGTAQKAVPILEKEAAKNYMNVLLPTTDDAVVAAEKIAPKMAKEKVMAISRNSLQAQAKQGMEYFGPKAETAFAQAQSVPLKKFEPIIEGIKDKVLYVKGTKVAPSGSEGLQEFFTGIQDDLKNLADKNGNVPAQIVDNYIDKINEGLVKANGGFRTSVAPGTIKKMEQQTAMAFRKMIDDPNTQAAQINAMYSLHRKVYDMMETLRKAGIKSKASVLTGTSKGAGAVIERNVPLYIRNGLRRVTGIFDSVPWQTLMGSTKQRIANALASDNLDEAANLMEEAAKPSQSLGTKIIKR